MSSVKWRVLAMWRWLKSLRCGCKCCGYPIATRKPQRTAYIEEDRNWATLCRGCHEKNDAYWDEMWAEYYRGCL